MNQKGNEPMTMLHAYIPVDLMQWLNDTADSAQGGKSEFVRLALEYVRASGVTIVQKTIFHPKKNGD